MSVVDTFTYITEGVLLSSVSLFGIVGNILSIVVLTINIKSTRIRKQNNFRNGINSQADFSM